MPLIDTIQRWSDAGADHLIFMIQAREHLPQEDVMASLKLFGEEVLPHFAEQDERLASGG
ncbi:MAG: hypothetical protein AAF387_18100 [Pseudomonadota bacterium]